MRRIIFKSLRIIYRVINKTTKNIFDKNRDKYEEQLYEKYVNLFDQQANDYCRDLLESGNPCMISKFGTVELFALIKYKSTKQKKYSWKEYIEFFQDMRPTLGWKDDINNLCKNAGFFPNDPNLLERFYQIYLDAMQDVDILGSYVYGEKFFENELKNAKKINIEGYLEPFLYNNPWTKVLNGKKVLVVHPFELSIRRQYKKRRLLWKSIEILPDFELITIKAEQTILGQASKYANWFDALDAMKEKIKNIDFDIALIGCGAYGMPLAAYIKQLGKQAVHLAGTTQILFGIKGKRWVDRPWIAKFMNEHWVNPLHEEVPQNHNKIEGGCYW